jgi:hypothetical protein
MPSLATQASILEIKCKQDEQEALLLSLAFRIRVSINIGSSVSNKVSAGFFETAVTLLLVLCQTLAL